MPEILSSDLHIVCLTRSSADATANFYSHQPGSALQKAIHVKGVIQRTGALEKVVIYVNTGNLSVSPGAAICHQVS